MQEEEQGILMQMYINFMMHEDCDMLISIEHFVESKKLRTRLNNKQMCHVSAVMLSKIKEEKNENKMLMLLKGLHLLLNIVYIEKDFAFITNAILVKLIYNPNEEVYQQKSEHLLLLVLDCLITCICAVEEDDLTIMYASGTYKLSPTIQSCILIAKFDTTRSIRKRAIECLMYYFQVYSSSKIINTKLRNAVILGFKDIVPGIATGLFISIQDEKCGSRILVTALRCWSRIIALMMLNTDKPQDVLETTLAMATPNKFENICRDRDWFSQHDDKLVLIVKRLAKLTSHDVPSVTRGLVEFCENLLDSRMIPKTLSYVIQILAILTQDCYAETSQKAEFLLENTIQEITKSDSVEFKIVLDHLQINFYNEIINLPQIFNGLDERKQLSSLSMFVGYLKFFTANETRSVLFSQINLDCLMNSLLVVAKLEVDSVNLLEEYCLQDLEAGADNRTPWKVFRFRDKDIQEKLEAVCSLLGLEETRDIILYYLIDVYRKQPENRKEATLIINEIMSKVNSSNLNLVNDIIHIYLEHEFWQLPLDGHNLCIIRNNIIQICLQLEGIGKMALAIGAKFEKFLLQLLYVVLEKAGSGLSLVRAAGLSSITNVSVACGYTSITELMNTNSDYFSYHVIRKLKREVQNECVLNVLSVVLTYSTVEVLLSISNIIDGILLDSFQKQTRKICSFLRVFLVFVKRIRKWFQVEVEPNTLKSKMEREHLHEDFRVSNIKYENDFSDDVMEKNEDELFDEDMNKSKGELETTYQDEMYQKPIPPLHVKLTKAILRQCVHYLPSPDATTRLLALEILIDGVVVLSDWEDELLPIVHEIFEPLLSCFDAIDTPLIINQSFRLLLTLAQLSKDFIRNRTTKHVFPILVQVLKSQAKESYLKDSGSAYHYTQAYKMQETILSQLGHLVYDLDLGENSIDTILIGVEPYLSNRQPKILQELAVKFYKTLKIIDDQISKKVIQALKQKCKLLYKEEFEDNVGFII